MAAAVSAAVAVAIAVVDAVAVAVNTVAVNAVFLACCSVVLDKRMMTMLYNNMHPNIVRCGKTLFFSSIGK